MEPKSYDPRFLRGIELFNSCAFFDAHEVWEGVWIDDESSGREFFKGLIQVAVCLLHFGNGNTRGARKLYFSSRRYLQPYAPIHLGLNVARLLGDMQRCCAELIACEDESRRVVVRPERIPEIHCDLPSPDVGT